MQRIGKVNVIYSNHQAIRFSFLVEISVSISLHLTPHVISSAIPTAKTWLIDSRKTLSRLFWRRFPFCCFYIQVLFTSTQVTLSSIYRTSINDRFTVCTRESFLVSKNLHMKLLCFWRRNMEWYHSEENLLKCEIVDSIEYFAQTIYSNWYLYRSNFSKILILI